MQPLLFSGNGNIPLATGIAKELGTKLSDVEIVRFADSECRVRIEADVEGKDVYVIQSVRNPVDEHLMEFLFLCDALKREDARRITAVVPYHGYARQDRVHRSGECVSAAVVAKLIEAVSVDKFVTVDLHSDAVVGFFKIPVVHLSGLSIFIDPMKKLKGSIVAVSPDAGGMKRTQKFAESIGAPLAFIEKKRDLDKLHTIESMKVVGDVKGKTAVIIDDIIVSGGTLVTAAYYLKQHGAREVVAIATHPDFVGGAEKILKESLVDRIWVGDTIPVNEDLLPDKLHIVSSAPILASQIRKMAKIEER